jgi:hypothetical protein
MKLKSKLINLYALLLSILAYTLDKSVFGLETLGNGLTTYNDAVVQGAYQQQMVISYDTNVYEDVEPYSKTMALLSKFGTETTDSNPKRGFQKTMPKSVFTLKADISIVEPSANNTVNVKLGYKEKDNLIKNQTCIFSFTSTGSGFTNEAIIIDKFPAIEDGEGGLGAIAGDYYIQIKPYDPTEKFGIANNTTISKDTTFIKFKATSYPDSSTSDTPPSWGEEVIENFYTFIKFPYAYNDLVASMNLYDKKGLKWRKDRDARIVFNGMKEDEFLFGGKVYYKPVTDSRDAASTQKSKMKGLIRSVKVGGSPAVVGYDGVLTTFADAHEEMMWALADPKIHENKRMVFCDQAYQKYWTDQKTSKPGVELAPNDSYGIPGITTVYTGYGNLELDLVVNDRISEWQRLITGNDRNSPFALACIPYKIKIYNFKDHEDRLYTEIQARDSTDHKSEYRCAFTWLGFNINTAAFGLIYKT